MFCINCGSQVREGSAFCGNCGSPAKSPQAAAPVVPPAPAYQAPQDYGAPAPPVAYSQPAAGPNDYPVEPPAYVPEGEGAADPGSPWDDPGTPSHGAGKCSWCGAAFTSAQTSCQSCGAALGIGTEVTEGGWGQLPGRHDMAKMQIGASSCQVEGAYVPVADFNLAAQDSVYFAHHVLLWKDPQVNVTTMPMAGAWKRMLAGMPLVMTQAQGPGHIAFSRDAPGEMISLPLQPGEQVDVREHLFLAATTGVDYTWFDPGIWFQTQSGNDTETHYPLGMFMDRFMAPQKPGLLLLHAAGNVFVRNLAAGEAILVKPTSLIFKDPTVGMQLHFERPGSGFTGWFGMSWGNRYLWLRMWGPGRVAISSVFDRVEGEARTITNFSYATEQRW